MARIRLALSLQIVIVEVETKSIFAMLFLLEDDLNKYEAGYLAPFWSFGNLLKILVE